MKRLKFKTDRQEKKLKFLLKCKHNFDLLNFPSRRDNYTRINTVLNKASLISLTEEKDVDHEMKIFHQLLSHPVP